MSAPFEPRSAADIAQLIADYPLAWLVSRAFHASPLPLLAETDARGAVVALVVIARCAMRSSPISGRTRTA